MKRNRERRADVFEADLAAARAAEPSYDIARGAARLSASLAAVGAASTAVASASVAGAVTKSGVTHGIAAKALAMLALSGVIVVVDARAPVSAPAVEAPAEASLRSIESTPQKVLPRPTAQLTAERSASASASASVSAATRPLTPPTARKVVSDRFGRELADVASARALLVADPSAALSAADKPSGSQALAEEREIIAIRALVSLGRMAAAKTRARDFLARRPESPFAPAARRLLAD